MCNIEFACYIGHKMLINVGKCRISVCNKINDPILYPQKENKLVLKRNIPCSLDEGLYAVFLATS